MVSVLLFSCKTKNITDNIKKEDINYIPYYLKVQEADSLYLTNNFERSYQILDSLFKIYKPLNTDTYQEYGIYLGSAVMSDHFEGIENKVRFGFSNFGHIGTNHKEWAAIYCGVIGAAHLSKNQIRSLKNEYKGKLNLDLRERIAKMFNEDQAARTKGKTHEEMELVDSRNAKKLDSIFNKYGYPANALIGSNNAFDPSDAPNDYIRIDVFFLHQPDSVKVKYLPVILENVKKGNCDPKVYALIYDRKMWENKDMQYYGSYKNQDGSLFQLMNPNKIDSIRKSIGLPHINYNDWRVKMFLNK